MWTSIRSGCGTCADAYASGDVAGVGGRAYLVYPGPKPAWLGESIEGLLTKVELGPHRRPAGVDELYGVNMSFRKDWLRRAGGFRPDLDRVGTRLTGGGDDDMIRRVIGAGRGHALRTGCRGRAPRAARTDATAVVLEPLLLGRRDRTPTLAGRASDRLPTAPSDLARRADGLAGRPGRTDDAARGRPTASARR